MEVRWEGLSLADLWANAATLPDREAARQLIEVASRRAATLVQADLANIRAPFVAGPLAGLDDEIALNRSEAEARKRLQLLVPSVNMAPAPGVPLELAKPLPCWLQRWLLLPVASLRWEAAQREAVLDASCADKSDLPVCVQRDKEREKERDKERDKEQGRLAVVRQETKAAMDALPAMRKKALTSLNGLPPSPLLTLGSSYVSKISSKLAIELKQPQPQRDALKKAIDDSCPA